MKKLFTILLTLLTVTAFSQRLTTGRGSDAKTLYFGGAYLYDTVGVHHVAETAFDGGMITKGDFAGITQSASTTGADWTTGTGWSIASGLASFDDANSSALAQPAGDMVSAVAINTAYTLTFDLTISGANTARLTISNAVVNINYTAAVDYTNGSKSVSFTTPANIGTGGFAFQCSAAGSTAAFTITNVKLTAD